MDETKNVSFNGDSSFAKLVIFIIIWGLPKIKYILQEIFLYMNINI